MDEKIVKSSVRIKLETLNGKFAFEAQTNLMNDHLGEHYPLIAALKHLGFVCACTSEEIKNQAIKSFNDGIKQGQQQNEKLNKSDSLGIFRDRIFADFRINTNDSVVKDNNYKGDSNASND